MRLNRHLLPAGYLVLATFGLAAAAQQMVVTGALYDLLAPLYREQQEFQLQNALFDTRGIDAVDLVVVGDPRFIASVRDALDGCATLLPLPVPEPRMSQIAYAVDATRSKDRSLTVIQNLPHFWSDLRDLSTRQRTHLWRASQRPASIRNLLLHANVFFQSLSDAVAGGRLSERLRPLEGSFAHISFRRPGLTRELAYVQLRRAIRALGVDTVYWFMADDGIPGDADAEFRAKITGMAMTGRGDRELGWMYAQSAMSAALRKPLLCHP